MNFRRASCAALATAFLLGLAWGCAATGDSGHANPGDGGTNVPVQPPNDASVVMPGQGTQDAGHLQQNPLCDKRSSSIPCVPDSPISCIAFTPSEDGGTTDDASATDDASMTGQGGQSGEGGSGGDSAGAAAPSNAGAGGESGAGEGGAGGASGAAGATSGPPPPPAKYACQVQRSEDQPNIPFARSALAGPGGENAPCLT